MSTLEASTKTTDFKREAYAADLIAALDHYGSKIKVLSLDCFDTILWRKTPTPIDVFYNLQQRPTFHSLGYSASLRVSSETTARKINMIQKMSDEVRLRDIYLAAFPQLNEEQLQNLIAEELAEEIDACYAFPPLIALIREAHARGIKIIIVSDTYLDTVQLRQLLASHLPEDVMSAIRKIYCSCEHDASKRDGIFTKILNQINVPPASILHIGDNKIADSLSPHAHGMKTLHLLHHNDGIAELLRMQALSGNFIDPLIRSTRAMASPFRGLLAAENIAMDKPEIALGYAALGPIMYAFAKFIANDVEELRQQGKKPKILFLMRDGHLPALTCAAIAGKEVGHRVRISRFVALASSFRTKSDVVRYLGDVANTLRFKDISRQLLLPAELATTIVKKAEDAGNYSGAEFIKLILDEKTLQVIFKQSTDYRNRLKKHLEREANLESGDTLVFVDLGYTGTAQIQLAPIFKDEMNVEIVGRYLISLRTPGWEANRRGLLDPSWCDDRSMLMLVSYIALLEQLCTSNDSSVVDFDIDGNPIFSDTTLSQQQHSKLTQIQNECVRFAREAENFFLGTKTQLSTTVLRDVSMAALCRLIFMPTETELQYLHSFEFDLNLGTKDILKVFDRNEGLLGLRKRGLFFMERNGKAMRTNYPAELRSAGLELSLILMAQHRYMVDIKMSDLSLLRESINLIVIHGNETTQTNVSAFPTHDGYFAAIIAVGTGNMQVGIQLGLNYRWIQIESAEFIRAASLMTEYESEHTADASSYLIADQMLDKNNGLFECLNSASLLMLNLPKTLFNENHVFKIVFRPVIRQEKALA